MLHGRGGSVSRRDLNRAYQRPPTLAWVCKSEETHKPIPSHSSGGGAGEALLLEKRPPPEFSHSLAGRGGSVSRRDLNRAYRRPPALAWVRKSDGRTKPIPSHSLGGGPGEALLLEKRPSPEFSHSLAGRGGSISRRDLDQAYRRPPALAWVRKSDGRTKPIPSHSSGEGVWGRGASLREAASPPASSPHPRLLGREREGGGFSTENPPPSQPTP